MNVLLLHAAPARRGYIERFQLTEALNGIYLGPALAAEHALHLVDLRVTPKLERELAGFLPDAAVVAVTPASLPELGRTLGRLRALHPRIHIVLVPAADYGNTWFQHRPEDLAHQAADAAVPALALAVQQRAVAALLSDWQGGGDGARVPGLLLRLGEQWIATEAMEDRIADIGVPDRTLLGRARGSYRFLGLGRMAYLLYTYGCRHACRYCTMSTSGGERHVRSLPDVVEELQRLSEPSVFIADFEPLQFPDALARLADAVEAEHLRKRFALMTRADSALAHIDLLRRWRELGLRWVYLGLDGWSAERLRTIRKGSALELHEAAVRRLQELGLAVAVGFVVPCDASREDFADIASAMRRLLPSMVDVTVETPLPGTRLFAETSPAVDRPELFDLAHALLPTRLPPDDFYAEITALHRLAFCLSTPGVLRHQPLRDLLRNACEGPAALWRAARARHDHATV